MFDIKGYLESKELTVKESSSGQLYTHCMFHGEDENKRGRLYISELDGDSWGLFYCQRCGEKGHFNKILQHFGDPPMDMDFDHTPRPIIEAAANFYQSKLAENVEAYRYLVEKRGLTQETIEKARIGWADPGLSTYLIGEGYTPEELQDSNLFHPYGSPYFENELIFPYVHFGTAIQLRGRPLDGKTRSMKEPNAMPYGIDWIMGEDTVTACEGEFDMLTLMQEGYAAIGVQGVHSFKDEWLEHLEDARRIFIAFDNDTAGRQGADKLASKIGPRARIIELPKKGVDVNDFFVKMGKTKDDFDYLIHKAKGGLIITMGEAYERWLEIEGNPDMTGIRFNVDALDSAMSFGLLPAQVFVLAARTGSGKSLMSMNYFQRMKLLDPELTFLYMSLELTRNEVFERMYRIHQLYFPCTTTKDFLEYWGNDLMLLDKNRISGNQFVDAIDQFTFETGRPTDLTCVDYIGYFARGLSGASEYDRVTSAIMLAKEAGKDYQTAMLMPTQVGRKGEFGEKLQADHAKSSSAIEETADIFTSLWSLDQAHDVEKATMTGGIRQEILKSRNGGSKTTAEYVMCPLTLAIVPVDDPVHYPRAQFTRRCYMAGDHWKDAVKRLKAAIDSGQLL